MKKLLILFSLVLLTGCSILYPDNNPTNSTSNNPNPNKPSNYFDPWDKLGGGGTFEDGSEENKSLNDFDNLYTSIDSVMVDNTISNEKVINLSTMTSLPSGVSYSSGLLYINAGGTYLLKGNLEGYILVDNCNDQDVRLIFDGISITSVGQVAPITFKKSSGNRIITLKENTVSILKDSTANVGDTADESLIEAKTVNLTINGKGTLNLASQSEHSTAIECKDKLYILDSTINIDATNNGMKIDNYIYFENANISIKALNDGIKTDIVPISLEEGKQLASSLNNGYISINNTDINIDAGDDGISANSFIYINNSEDNEIDIKTNGGTPEVLSEKVSDSVSGKAIKVNGITYLEGTKETFIPSTHENNYSLVINGGNIHLNSNSDALSSKGNILIEKGELSITSGDDGIHAEYLVTIRNGTVDVQKSYEGIEGAAVEIYDGYINVISMDDGINASNSDVKYDNYIYIENGRIYVNSEGDGVDSNGRIEIKGGTLAIDGPTGGMNGALDSDKGILVEDGEVIAVGSRGMVERPSSNSTQYYLDINLSERTTGTISIYNSDNQMIFSFTPEKDYQSVILSSYKFIKGETYYVELGTLNYEVTINSIGTALGTNSSGNNNQGYNPNGRPPRK